MDEDIIFPIVIFLTIFFLAFGIIGGGLFYNIGDSVTIHKEILDNICKEKFGNDTIAYTPNYLDAEKSLRCKEIKKIQYDHQEIYLVGEDG